VAVSYRVQESGDALEIFVRNEISLFLRVACGGFAGWLIWFLIGTHLPSFLRIGLAIVAGVVVVVMFRQMTARLTVTASEFQVGGARRGAGEKAVRGSLLLPASKIYRLEYQEHESGGQGLYAVTLTGEPVLLPHIDAAQAREIIAAIKKKFPGFAEAWKKSEDAAAKARG
jgi:hypothetical protein